jgi:regulator of cell morphogenesis and NO signaling
MNIQENNIIGELVAKDYRTASVFKDYGIDFCCNGSRTIAEACEDRNLETVSVIQNLEFAIQSNTELTPEYKSWPLDLLTDYIEKKHHRYVEKRSMEIKPYLEKICAVHGNAHPELFEIKTEFDASVGELAMYMKREELILFPFVRKMVKAKLNDLKTGIPRFGSVQNPIQTMMLEHTLEGERFRLIAELSDNYTPPIDACNTYKLTFALLKEFEEDLHLHIHLENNILFPKAIELEQLLYAS